MSVLVGILALWFVLWLWVTLTNTSREVLRLRDQVFLLSERLQNAERTSEQIWDKFSEFRDEYREANRRWSDDDPCSPP